MKTIGSRLKEARKLAKKTQQQVADACGVSREAVSQWESGGAKFPRPEHLFKAADFLKMDPRQLVFGASGVSRFPDKGNGRGPTELIDFVDLKVFAKTVTDVDAAVDDTLEPEKKAKLLLLVYDRYAETGASDRTAVQRYLKAVA